MNIQTQTFNSNTNVRVIDNTWFVAKDLCDGLEIKDAAKAVRTIESQLNQADIPDTISNRISLHDGKQSREVSVVNETGLNLLMMQSRKKEAIRFKHWIASEVLPSIRKTGRYEIPQEGLTPEQQRHIQEAVSAIFIRDGIHYSTTYHNIKTEFRVGTYKDIPQEQYPALCRFLNIEPVHKTKDEPEPKVDLRQLSEFMNFTAERINHLSQAEYTMGKMLKSMQEMHQDMQEHRYKTHDLAFDLKVFANRLSA